MLEEIIKMGRASQIYWYLNADRAPNRLEELHHYTHLTFTKELKMLRSSHRRLLKKLAEERRADDEINLF
jgi:hypothetical protein